MAAIEKGIPYTVWTPDLGKTFVLNSPSDSNFVGYVEDITGLDSPGIRENAQVVVAGDGGYHGSFWADRRPWTLSGFIMPTFPLLARDQAQEKIQGILFQALRSDGFLTWTPADGIARQLAFRAQQPPRITTGQSNVQKKFQVACVTADFRIVSATALSVQAHGASSPVTLPTAQNLGNTDARPRFTIDGPYSGTISIVNNSTSKTLTLTGVTIPSGQSWVVDLTGTYPSVTDQSGNNQDGAIDPLNTDWSIAVAGTLTVPSGNNVFKIFGSGTSSLSGMTVLWSHSWI